MARKEPTYKQKRWTEEYIKNKGNATEAALLSYNTTNRASAQVIASKNLRKPHVQEYMRQLLEEEGLGPKEVTRTLRKFVDAATTDESLKKVTPADGLRALDMGNRLADYYPAEKKQIQKQTAVLNMNLEAKSEAELSEILQGLMEETKRFQKILKDSKNHEQQLTE
jgi:phage terminase small subunit